MVAVDPTVVRVGEKDGLKNQVGTIAAGELDKWVRSAAHWNEQGPSPKRIRTLIGHASIAQTSDQYGSLFEARDDEAAMMAGVEKRLI